MQRRIALVIVAAVLSAAATLAIVAANAQALYAWHWQTFVYKGAPTAPR